MTNSEEAGDGEVPAAALAEAAAVDAPDVAPVKAELSLDDVSEAHSLGNGHGNGEQGTAGLGATPSESPRSQNGEAGHGASANGGNESGAPLATSQREERAGAGDEPAGGNGQGAHDGWLADLGGWMAPQQVDDDDFFADFAGPPSAQAQEPAPEATVAATSTVDAEAPADHQDAPAAGSDEHDGSDVSQRDCASDGGRERALSDGDGSHRCSGASDAEDDVQADRGADAGSDSRERVEEEALEASCAASDASGARPDGDKLSGGDDGCSGGVGLDDDDGWGDMAFAEPIPGLGEAPRDTSPAREAPSSLPHTHDEGPIAGAAGEPGGAADGDDFDDGFDDDGFDDFVTADAAPPPAQAPPSLPASQPATPVEPPAPAAAPSSYDPTQRVAQAVTALLGALGFHLDITYAGTQPRAPTATHTPGPSFRALAAQQSRSLPAPRPLRQSDPRQVLADAALRAAEVLRQTQHLGEDAGASGRGGPAGQRPEGAGSREVAARRMRGAHQFASHSAGASMDLDEMVSSYLPASADAAASQNEAPLDPAGWDFAGSDAARGSTSAAAGQPAAQGGNFLEWTFDTPAAATAVEPQPRTSAGGLEALEAATAVSRDAGPEAPQGAAMPPASGEVLTDSGVFEGFGEPATPPVPLVDSTDAFALSGGAPSAPVAQGGVPEATHISDADDDDEFGDFGDFEAPSAAPAAASAAPALDEAWGDVAAPLDAGAAPQDEPKPAGVVWAGEEPEGDDSGHMGGFEGFQQPKSFDGSVGAIAGSESSLRRDGLLRPGSAAQSSSGNGDEDEYEDWGWAEVAKPAADRSRPTVTDVRVSFGEPEGAVADASSTDQQSASHHAVRGARFELPEGVVLEAVDGDDAAAPQLDILVPARGGDSVAGAPNLSPRSTLASVSKSYPPSLARGGASVAAADDRDDDAAAVLGAKPPESPPRKNDDGDDDEFSDHFEEYVGPSEGLPALGPPPIRRSSVRGALAVDRPAQAPSDAGSEVPQDELEEFDSWATALAQKRERLLAGPERQPSEGSTHGPGNVTVASGSVYAAWSAMGEWGEGLSARSVSLRDGRGAERGADVRDEISSVGEGSRMSVAGRGASVAGGAGPSGGPPPGGRRVGGARVGSALSEAGTATRSEEGEREAWGAPELDTASLSAFSVASTTHSHLPALRENQAWEELAASGSMNVGVSGTDTPTRWGGVPPELARIAQRILSPAVAGGDRRGRGRRAGLPGMPYVTPRMGAQGDNRVAASVASSEGVGLEGAARGYDAQGPPSVAQFSTGDADADADDDFGEFLDSSGRRQTARDTTGPPSPEPAAASQEVAAAGGADAGDDEFGGFEGATPPPQPTASQPLAGDPLSPLDFGEPVGGTPPGLTAAMSAAAASGPPHDAAPQGASHLFQVASTGPSPQRPPAPLPGLSVWGAGAAAVQPPTPTFAGTTLPDPASSAPAGPSSLQPLQLSEDDFGDFADAHQSGEPSAAPPPAASSSWSFAPHPAPQPLGPAAAPGASAATEEISGPVKPSWVPLKPGEKPASEQKPQSFAQAAGILGAGPATRAGPQQDRSDQGADSALFSDLSAAEPRIARRGVAGASAGARGPAVSMRAARGKKTKPQTPPGDEFGEFTGGGGEGDFGDFVG
ncbi:unnamed protein product [Pedinophyceae sp. YPF-701]|nr:unnamed protein product [Pedinophyceae sp. YPF-701]